MKIKLFGLRILTSRKLQDDLARTYRMAEKAGFMAGYVKGALDQKEGRARVEFYSTRRDMDRAYSILKKEGLVE